MLRRYVLAMVAALLVVPAAGAGVPGASSGSAERSGVEQSTVHVAFNIKVNTLVDEWSVDPDPAKNASSDCSLREAIQATVTGNPLGNQGCGPTSVGNFDEYTFKMQGGTHLLSRPEELPDVSKRITID